MSSNVETPRNGTGTERGVHRYAVAVSGLTFVTVVFALMIVPRSAVQLPDHVFPLNSAGIAPVSEEKCFSCHEDHVVRFEEAPHHNTLLPGDDPLVTELLNGKTFTDADSGAEFRYARRDKSVWLESSRRSRPLRVDWLFGSGHHARTPVTVVENPGGGTSVLQHVMSWYPDDAIGWTLGLTEEQRDRPGIEGVAQPHTAQESRSCLMCHTTWLPETEDRLDLARTLPNVSCTRCHTQAEAHVTHAENGNIQDWSALTPLESVNRCGECHRRADHFTADELSTSNELLVRFASASLVQTSCFVNQLPETRFDCMTCHDPHERASANPVFYDQRCIVCHQSNAVCSFSETTDECISCHMPKIEIHEGLKFTDHWIRIRD
ncbi:MAG: multiheme c-type cytochrome [Fuerstiella sp.]|nr:multiheme c-type cytochrome [Fuerstiella sp.]